jgi:hypothetical protein
MPHIEIMKFCQNRWSLPTRYPFLFQRFAAKMSISALIFFIKTVPIYCTNVQECTAFAKVMYDIDLSFKRLVEQ